MSKIVNMYAAKTHLSDLVDRAERGEEIVIARAGRPVARLVGIAPPKSRKPGGWRGRVWIAADFDAPLPEELLRTFEGLDE